MERERKWLRKGERETERERMRIAFCNRLSCGRDATTFYRVDFTEKKDIDNGENGVKGEREN